MKEAFFPTRARRARVRRPLPFRPLAALILAGQLGAVWAEAPRLSESAATAAALPPNPVLAYGHERIGTVGGDATERTITLSQTFDVSGRRALRRDAASERLDATRLDGQDRQLATIAEVRRAFAETLHHERSEAAIGRWLQRITAAAEVAGQLARAGEASGYDRRRIEREAQTARSRLAAARADAARSRERLAVLAGTQPEDALHLVGDLVPEAAPALADGETTLRRQPDLASLETRAKACEHERRAAERGWVSDLTLGVGQKRVAEPSMRSR